MARGISVSGIIIAAAALMPSYARSSWPIDRVTRGRPHTLSGRRLEIAVFSHEESRAPSAAAAEVERDAETGPHRRPYHEGAAWRCERAINIAGAKASLRVARRPSLGVALIISSVETAWREIIEIRAGIHGGDFFGAMY